MLYYKYHFYAYYYKNKHLEYYKCYQRTFPKLFHILIVIHNKGIGNFLISYQISLYLSISQLHIRHIYSLLKCRIQSNFEFSFTQPLHNVSYIFLNIPISIPYPT